MEYELEKTTIPLILKSGDTNKFLREDCHVALDHMVLIDIDYFYTSALYQMDIIYHTARFDNFYLIISFLFNR